MTLALDATDCTPHLQTSIQRMRQVIPGAGCGLPAAALHDRAVATWVRDHGLTMTAHNSGELDLVRHHGIRPVQVVFRCGSVSDDMRRAVNLGVSRFVVGTAPQMARLAECAHRTVYVYLDEHAPLVLGDRKLKVIGLHSDVDDDGGAVEWAAAAERLLCRTALLKTCGSSIIRLSLSGGSTLDWLNDQASQVMSIVTAVDDALRQGCGRWHLWRPAVTLSPLTGLE